MKNLKILPLLILNLDSNITRDALDLLTMKLKAREKHLKEILRRKKNKIKNQNRKDKIKFMFQSLMNLVLI